MKVRVLKVFCIATLCYIGRLTYAERQDNVGLVKFIDADENIEQDNVDSFIPERLYCATTWRVPWKIRWKVGENNKKILTEVTHPFHSKALEEYEMQLNEMTYTFYKFTHNYIIYNITCFNTPDIAPDRFIPKVTSKQIFSSIVWEYAGHTELNNGQLVLREVPLFKLLNLRITKKWQETSFKQDPDELYISYESHDCNQESSSQRLSLSPELYKEHCRFVTPVTREVSIFDQSHPTQPSRYRPQGCKELRDKAVSELENHQSLGESTFNETNLYYYPTVRTATHYYNIPSIKFRLITDLMKRSWMPRSHNGTNCKFLVPSLCVIFAEYGKARLKLGTKRDVKMAGGKQRSKRKASDEPSPPEKCKYPRLLKATAGVKTFVKRAKQTFGTIKATFTPRSSPSHDSTTRPHDAESISANPVSTNSGDQESVYYPGFQQHVSGNTPGPQTIPINENSDRSEAESSNFLSESNTSISDKSQANPNPSSLIDSKYGPANDYNAVDAYGSLFPGTDDVGDG